MAATTVQEVVEEALINQFLDPSAKLDPEKGGGEEGAPEEEGICVEDLDWWVYDRNLALWYCEWLDSFYDSTDRVFMRRDELTNLLEPADMAWLEEMSARLQLPLPRYNAVVVPVAEEPPPVVQEVVVAEEEVPVAVEEPAEVEAPPPEDGGWHAAAAAADAEPAEEQVAWEEDGLGNLQHWCKEKGRFFLWREEAGVLYEYANGRYTALWALYGPLCALTRSDDGASRLLTGGAVDLGADPGEEGWALLGWADLAPAHARVFVGPSGRWLLKALSQDHATLLLDGKQVPWGRALRLSNGSIIRLGEGLELVVDLPDYPFAPQEDEEEKQGGGEAVVEKAFVPSEEAAEVPPEAAPDGTATARALNAALRRALSCKTPREAAEERRREEQYEDQAAKRRRLHPEPTATDALLMRYAPGQEVEGQEAGGRGPTGAELYARDVAGAMDAEGRYIGKSRENAGLGYNGSDAGGVL